MAESSQVRRIEVRVTGTGIDSLKSISKGFREVNNNVRQTTSVISSFRNAFLAIQGLSFAGIGVREIVQATDAMQKFGNRLEVTEGSAIGAAARLKQLTQVANNNFTSIEDVAVVYNRLSQALNDVGVSSRDVVILTDRLQKTFRISGSTAAEATAATIQLSQGLASGQIRGQELRSVLEANVVIGRLLSKQLGVTRGELLKFAEKQGGISAVDFLNAVSAGAAELDSQAKKLKPTIQEALIANFNTLKVTLNDLNKEFLISEKIIAGINVVFKNLDLVVATAGILALAKAATFLYSQFVLVSGVITAFVAKAVGSAFVVTIVKAATVTASFVAGIATLPLAITAAVTGFVLAFSTIESFRESVISTTKSIAEFLKLSFRTPEYQKQYLDQKKAAEQLEIAQREAAKTTRLYIFEQSDLEKQFISTFDALEKGTAALGPIQKKFDQLGESTIEAKKGAFDFKTQLGILNEQFFNNAISLNEYNKRLKELQLKDLQKDAIAGSITLEQYNKRLQEINFGKIKNTLNLFRFDLKLLNAEFGKTGDIALYAERLSEVQIKRLNTELKEGRTDLLQYNSSINVEKIEALNRAYAQGSISLGQYNEAVNNARFDELDRQFKAGKISAQDFNKQLTEIEGKFSFGGALLTGATNYIQSAGTLSTNVANAITQTFGRLEDSLVQFTQTGKFVFRDFAKAVIEDINRIIIRALIIRPIAQGILSFGGPDAAGGTTSQSAGYLAGNTGGFAKGGAFNNGVQMFAKGGIVDSMTPFSYGRGKLGVAGEAGPEAILPLKRDGQGNLGVKAAPSNVVVNVINQSGAETEQRESVGQDGTRIIDILIVNKVREGFASGAFDRQLGEQYGLRRRGI
jgi:lambda family phage tail tape measure protein